ncbi:MAG: Methionyl-tRNA formyltransferase [candidate division WS2 bacterium ADurb.Bin280]|uniref:methionyl-tRNA formyltransferase n=1 Tax=candidate division WS2 bacterium ADurb.Bin280 TaxID=1852829 RepID=A0A1V5SG62_9BACT|nr:MAG: Methionyl-tRNA formyltransferase [candidate division WS2 bacterium ADurb.Bin280]
MIVFSSDSDFLTIKNILEKNSFKIDLLVSEPPKPSGRGQKLKKNIAHLTAEQSKIITLTPQELDQLSREKIKRALDSSSDKMGFVFSYGKIITKDIIDLFEGKLVNLHPSLLPAYRGATPIQSAILNRDPRTGYSLIKLSQRMDAGDIFYQKSFEITPNDNYQTVFEKIIDDFEKNGIEVLHDISTDEATAMTQDEDKATYTKKIKKADGQILQNIDSPESALAKINAFSRWPKAFFILDGTRLIIHQASIENDKLVLEKVQREGQKTMPFADFKRGNARLLTFLPDFVKI